MVFLDVLPVNNVLQNIVPYPPNSLELFFSENATILHEQ